MIQNVVYLFSLTGDSLDMFIPRKWQSQLKAFQYTNSYVADDQLHE